MLYRNARKNYPFEATTKRLIDQNYKIKNNYKNNNSLSKTNYETLYENNNNK
jgi:hypothetical protein